MEYAWRRRSTGLPSEPCSKPIGCPRLRYLPAFQPLTRTEIFSLNGKSAVFLYDD